MGLHRLFVIFQPLFLVDFPSVSDTTAGIAALTVRSGANEDENFRTIHGVSQGVRHDSIISHKNPCKSFPSVVPPRNEKRGKLVQKPSDVSKNR